MLGLLNRLFITAFLPSLGVILTLLAPPGMSQANVQGQWQTLPYTMPINPVHVALLYTGKVLIVTGSGNDATNTLLQAGIWDPQAGTITTQTVSWDMFCNGMAILPDGRPFIVGGTTQYNPFAGSPRTSIYDPATNTFTDAQSMADGRWYPTTTVLGDGRVMVFSGIDQNHVTNLNVELYTAGSVWSSPLAAPWTPPPYPRMHLLPNGNVFYAGSGTISKTYSPSTNVWNTAVAVTNDGNSRTYGSSVLLPLTPANGYKPRVMILGGGNPATATTEIIDLSVATPTWVTGPSMSEPRIEMDATILPSGKVLAVNGSLNDEDISTASLNADLYDPNANTFSSAGAEAYAHLYHSVSLLMPDATVWVAGGNPRSPNFEPHMEVYSPAYLFNSNGSLAARPSISTLSSSVIGYGGAFTVQTPDAANISTVVLMRNGSSTHAFDTEQRSVGLSFTTGSGVLNVTGPPNGNIAPPGYYMLFILNSAGVPSVASMVQISQAPGDQPPTGTIVTPSSNVTIAAGQPVSYAGTGTDPDGSISAYSWFFEGGSPSTSSLANPGSVTYPVAGTYNTTLTVTDNSGLTDPHPPSRTITVTGASLAATPTFSPGGGTYSNTQSVAISDTTTGATIFYTLDGTTPGTSVGGSTKQYTAPISVTATETIEALATASGFSSSAVASATYTISTGGTAAVNFGSGFTAVGLQFSGNTKLNGTRLQLTDTTTANEVASAFWTTPVNVQTFTNNFTFQQTAPNADGFTFTIQGVGATAIGPGGGGLGFGPNAPGGSGGLASSVCVKFDLYDNQGEGPNSTGLYLNGASPTIPATALGGGVNLHSGDVFQVQMTYDGTTLTMTMTDTTTPAETFTTSWAVNIPGTVGGNTAYAGFTAGTGGLTAQQEIITWTYSTTNGTSSPVATPTFNPAGGTYSNTQSVAISDTTTGATIFYTLDGTTPGTSVGGSTKQYAAPISVTATETIEALATAMGFSTSAVATSTYNISAVSPPTFVSLAPSSGSGLTQTFSLVVSDPSGLPDLITTHLLFNTTSANQVSACSLYYSVAANQWFLYNDAGTTLSAAVTPGSATTVSNSQCTLAGAGSSISKSGNNLTLNVALTFTTTFTGLKNVYGLASGKDGLSTGWVQEGTWTP